MVQITKSTTKLHEIRQQEEEENRKNSENISPELGAGDLLDDADDLLDDACDSLDDAGAVKIKPFTPSKLPDFSNIKLTPRTRSVKKPAASTSTPQTRQRQTRVPNSPQPPKASPAPAYSPVVRLTRLRNEEDLRKSLLKSREQLRRTPGVKRSPGRTPARRKRQLDLGDQSDLVTYALRKKFHNMRRLYNSPTSADGDSSINISID